MRRPRLAILIFVPLLAPFTIPAIAAPAVTVETAAQEIVGSEKADGDRVYRIVHSGSVRSESRRSRRRAA